MTDLHDRDRDAQDQSLDLAYHQMAKDEAREADALELIESVVGDGHRTVRIDATIELRDFFRAYVDASKVKLAIACAIVVALIAGFTYFFILIGEEHILLELSPLFFGLPLIVIAGQYLRIQAAYRKYLADLSESEKKVLYIFAEQGDGFEIVNGKNFGHLSWESVRAVVERTHYFRIVLNRYEALVISKRFVHGESDLLLLREIISSHLGSNAKLLAE